VFLGATQFKEGRFNAWGTLLAVTVLGVGTTGLGLAGAAPWTGSMFTGVVLITALAVTGVQRRSGVAARRWRLVGRRSTASADPPQDGPRARGEGAALDIELDLRSDDLLNERA